MKILKFLCAGLVIGFLSIFWQPLALLGILLASYGFIEFQAVRHANLFASGQTINHVFENGLRGVGSFALSVVINAVGIDFYRVIYLTMFNWFVIGGVFMVILNDLRGKPFLYISKTGGFFDKVFLGISERFGGGYYALALVLISLLFGYLYLTN